MAVTIHEPGRRSTLIGRWRWTIRGTSLGSFSSARIWSGRSPASRWTAKTTLDWISRASWGRGIASQALHLLLREVAKRPLVAAAATSNGASLRVLQKCGFVVERIRLSPASDRFPECEESSSCCGKARRRHGGSRSLMERHNQVDAHMKQNVAKGPKQLAHLEDIPNIGPAIAADLRQLGITFLRIAGA